MESAMLIAAQKRLCLALLDTLDDDVMRRVGGLIISSQQTGSTIIGMEMTPKFDQIVRWITDNKDMVVGQASAAAAAAVQRRSGGAPGLQTSIYREAALGTPQQYLHLSLLFRATRDGWSEDDFYRQCTNPGSTLVLIKTTEHHVFGGYADAPWEKDENEIPSSRGGAFLFDLRATETDKPPLKMRLVFNSEAWAKAMGSPPFMPIVFGSTRFMEFALTARAGEAGYDPNQHLKFLFSNIGKNGIYKKPSEGELAKRRYHEVAEVEVYRETWS